MGETNGNHRSIFSMRSTAAPPPSRVPRGRTQMAKSIARFLVAVMAVAAMALASVAGTGLAQAQTNTPTDRAALAALYNATSGDNWANNDNWLSDKPLGEWHGVTTDSDGRVRRLYLQDNQLSGEVPSELGNLSNLEWLWLQRNQLSGVPSELGSLSNLESLDLSGNQLSGVPPELGSLSNLESLDLSGNQLSGVPPELGNLSNLTHLYLSDNQLSGEVPSELGNLSNLTHLYLQDNQLSGEVSSELGSLSNLEWLWLQRNQLSGVPPELGSLSNLERLNLSDNQLSGVPSELGSLSNLESLDLSGNQLSGVPPELGSLSNLESLDLSGNQLSGVPPELGNLSNLTHLYLSDNQLSGEVPSELGNLSNLTHLYLQDNQLSGEVSSELGSLSNLEWLWLQRNQLSGEIPLELGSLSLSNQPGVVGPIRQPAERGDTARTGHPLQPEGVIHLRQPIDRVHPGGCIPAGIRGVVNNDLNQLDLPLCEGPLGAPTITAVTPGAVFLTVTWAAPGGTGGPAISAYDLRYIQTSADETVDANWTVEGDAWTAGSGALSYRISGLTDGTRYAVQVRAVSAAGDGPWSAAAAGTPATWGAIRSFSPPSVAPAGEVVVMITASGYGWFGAVTETLPPGFSYVSSSLEDSGVTDVGREVYFSLFEQTAFTYTVTAPSAEGTYSFSGVLRNSDREDVPVGGALTIAVAAGDPLIVRYDANGNGMIEKNEVIAAINDYLFAEGDAAISKSDVIKLINLYLFG